ncbi:unnamed protein product [Fraxinus pennsylvanica]|uniref:Uncharacterized protein n=1 Tax=Fraxinus pennsylvanica TaxID=56036 RepID=A0AAD1YXE4_9LAMI|nr:unnamed protein product [Fraxinus pennsylvanica]
MPDNRMSRKDFDFQQSSNLPPRSENMVQKSSNESTHHNYGGCGARSIGHARQIVGSEYNIERSPLNPHSQGKVAERGNGYPSSKEKNSYDSNHGNPGRSRLRPATMRDKTISLINFSLISLSDFIR